MRAQQLLAAAAASATTSPPPPPSASASSDLIVSNVKAHFSVQAPIPVPDSISDHVVYHGNFLTVRPPPSLVKHLTDRAKLVYVVFPSSGHVNVSGIKDFDTCYQAVQVFEHLFSVKATSDICVDNSTASGRFPVIDNLRLSRLFDKVEEFAFPCTISIRPHYFPSVLLRPAQRSLPEPNLISTSIVFTNGKFIIVGSKTRAQVARTYHNLNHIIRSII